MKNRPYLKSFYSSFIIGFAGISAMTSSVQAVDIGMPVLDKMSVQRHSQLQPTDKPATAASSNNATSLQGMQGPMRTETFNEPKPKVDSEMVRRDLEMQRYPMANNVGIP